MLLLILSTLRCWPMYSADAARKVQWPYLVASYARTMSYVNTAVRVCINAYFFLTSNVTRFLFCIFLAILRRRGVAL